MTCRRFASSHGIARLSAAAIVIASGLTHESKLMGVEDGVHKVGEVLLGCLMGLLVSWALSRVWPLHQVQAKAT